MKPAQSVNPRYILIQPAVVKIEQDKVLQMTEEARMKEAKAQNRGTVILIGKDCKQWIEPGDNVSFYRNAATPFKGDDGEEYILVHEDHVLLKY
ncbi:MAG TPA: hypothetical protein PKI55_04210 [Chitinophagaceae bacterium]|nr:hypothetical protein [Chitinophagaceae bacterium]